jgi:hypothetical protein
MVIIRLPAAAVLALSYSAILCPSRADTFSAVPIADAFVATGTPTNNLSGDNFGAAGSLTVEAGNLPQGEFQTVIEFDLSGAQSYFNSEYGAGGWTAQTVLLKLTGSPHGNSMFNPPAAGEFAISLMQNNSWVEGTGTGGAPTTNGITYDSLESSYINDATDQALGSFSFVGGTSGTANYGLNLSSGLLGDLMAGTNLSLRLFPTDTNVSYLFNSRMAASSGPALLITVAPQAIPYQLALALSGGNLVISWPTNESSGAVLQQNSVLSSSNWITTPTNFLTVTNGQYQVLASPTNAAQFFRLYTP